jgi:hypothetical protein
MAEKKIIAVTGATGAQAGGLARALLNDPSGEFALRAVTRDPNKEAARALADRGATVVQADLDDEASLRSAFDGAYGAYCLTNFWEHFNGEKETCQSRGLTGLVPRMGVGYSFYSTVYPGTSPLPFNSIVAQLGAAAPGVGFGRRASSCIIAVHRSELWE